LRLGLPQSIFSWQGGEPTLAGLEFYRAAVRLMQSYGRGGQAVSNALQTNGLVIDADWCRFLRDYQFLVGLSIDGPADVHDRYRVFAGGEGSHAQALRAMQRLKENNVPFNVLAVVTDASAAQARRIYSWFREQGVTHMQFIPCVESEDDGRPAPFSVSAEAFGDFLCELFDAWLPEARSGVSERLFDALLQRELTGRSGMCVLDGACGEYLVVEHNGDAYPCDFFVEESRRLGNIAATPIETLMRRGRMRQFRAARRLPAECADCAWKELCRGGCLKDRARFGGGFDRPTTLCLAYRRLFEHAMPSIRALAEEIRPVPMTPPPP
jgi:uncharacterized protein